MRAPRLPRLGLLVACALGGLLLGCAPEMKQVAPGRPYVLYLPGSSGWTAFDDAFVDELRRQDPARQIEVYDWTGWRKGAGALMDLESNRAEGGKVARKLESRLQSIGGGPCDIVGHSAGTGVAIFALERLPPGVKVRHVVLLASALSSGYDLAPALEHVGGKLYVTVSEGDELLRFTRALGTVDRAFGPSAGEAGFSASHGDQVVIVRTNRGHVGALGPGFARETIGPLLR